MTLSLNSWNLRNSRVCGKSSTQGALTGVGLSIGYPLALNGSPTGLSVMSAVPGGHAEKAGIVSGDVILAIDNKSAQDMDIYDAADRLQGPEGSSIDSDMRERYTLNPVRSRMCEILGSEDSSKIGYIKLTTFNQNAAGSVKEAIKKLRENNVKAFVLDLQNNSGGLFPEGIEIAKIWMDKGVIVCICDSRGVRYIYEADGASMIAASEPLVILVLQRNCKRKRDPCRSTERQQKSSGVWGTNIWKRQQSLTSGGRLMQQ